MSTIVALSSPPGRAAISIIRLSGPEVRRIGAALTSDPSFLDSPRQSFLRRIHTFETSEVIDQAILTYMQSPNSFTGEDMLEISCHGSPIVVRRIIDLVLALGGQLAEAGEFSLRALSHGKLDLSQAEAIRDLINAQTEAAARQAQRQLNGELSNKLQPLKQSLIEVIVRLESAVEFVEDDLPAVQSRELAAKLRALALDLDQLAATFAVGHWLRSGAKATIAGRPNVGKSSLFNSLLRRDRAIVTHLPGTTRDTLSETVNICGIPVSLTDTAGVRKTPDEIETIGIERAQMAIADADLVLFVIDGTSELTEDDRLIFRKLRASKFLLVVNKLDQPGFGSRYSEFEPARSVSVSALRGDGLEELCEAAIDELGANNFEAGDLLVTDARHYDLLCKTSEQIGEAICLLEREATEELVLVGLNNALTLLGAITGETTSNDILSQIFATFCIGK